MEILDVGEQRAMRVFLFILLSQHFAIAVSHLSFSKNSCIRFMFVIVSFLVCGIKGFILCIFVVFISECSQYVSFARALVGDVEWRKRESRNKKEIAFWGFTVF